CRPGGIVPKPAKNVHGQRLVFGEGQHLRPEIAKLLSRLFNALVRRTAKGEDRVVFTDLIKRSGRREVCELVQPPENFATQVEEAPDRPGNESGQDPTDGTRGSCPQNRPHVDSPSVCLRRGMILPDTVPVTTADWAAHRRAAMQATPEQLVGASLPDVLLPYQ